MDDTKPVKKDLFFIFKIICIVGAVALVGIIFYSCFAGKNVTANNSSTPGTKSEQSQQIEALVGSQQVVRDSLKSPSSAKFPTIVDSNVIIRKISTDKYSVAAYVDSENSFGAMLRTYYACSVTLFEDRYKVEDLQFQE